MKLPEPIGYVSKTGHGTYFRETITPELRALEWAGRPMWKPLYDEPTVRRLIAEAKAEEREGLVLVPVEPTEAMIQAAHDALESYPLEGNIRRHYRAMLAARPEAPTVSLTEGQADRGLPPLPSPATRTDFHHDGYGLPAYTADQMHVHAALAAAIERERCARICEQSDDEGEGPDSWGWHSKDYAKAIRKEVGA